MNSSKEWSIWSYLNKSEISAVPISSGVYQIRVVDKKGLPRCIDRCFGEDKDGLIDIGESGNLRTRLYSLQKCMGDKNQSGHMAGWRYASIDMNRIFPLELVQFCYRTTDDKNAAYDLEGKLLHAYLGRHYELPPLNYKFNWSVLSKQ